MYSRQNFLPLYSFDKCIVSREEECLNVFRIFDVTCSYHTLLIACSQSPNKSLVWLWVPHQVHSCLILAIADCQPRTYRH